MDNAKQTKCGCRAPQPHADCAYCGSGPSNGVCGICSANGIDGPVIRGTARRTCKVHKLARAAAYRRAEALAKVSALRDEAGAAGDQAQVDLCDAALGGDDAALAKCELAIRSAQAQAEDLDTDERLAGYLAVKR